jgi:hypothetical protein
LAAPIDGTRKIPQRAATRREMRVVIQVREAWRVPSAVLFLARTVVYSELSVYSRVWKWWRAFR